MLTNRSEIARKLRMQWQLFHAHCTLNEIKVRPRSSPMHAPIAHLAINNTQNCASTEKEQVKRGKRASGRDCGDEKWKCDSCAIGAHNFSNLNLIFTRGAIREYVRAGKWTSEQASKQAARQKMCYELWGLRAGVRKRRGLNFYKALFVALWTDRVCNYVARAIYVAARRDGSDGADAPDRPAGAARFRR